MLLAFCIPTYNRCSLLKICINSIIDDIISSDLKEDVQICISDNASTDGTEDMINTLQQLGVNIVYYKNEQNIGPDLNYLKCISLSTADFCWFMGSDDAIVPGSILNIIDKISTYQADAYIVDRLLCDINLNPIGEKSFFNILHQSIYSFTDRHDLISYFNSSESLGAVFSYLSSIIVNRKKWNLIEYDTSYTGTAYSHVFIIISFLLKSGYLMPNKEPLIYCRLENDSFLDGGSVKRFMIDVDGYIKLAKEFFLNDDELRLSFLRILTREHSYIRILRMRAVVSKTEWEIISAKLLYCGFNKKKLDILKHMPFVLLLMMRPIIYLKTFTDKIRNKIPKAVIK